MKLVYYAWGAYNDQVFQHNLKSMGFELVIFSENCTNYTRDLTFAASLMNVINTSGAEAVISFDYFPIISLACDTCKIPYYAWVYDSPHKTLQAKCVNLACNHIGVFDRELVEKMKGEGIQTVYHAPLAVDTHSFDYLIKENDDDAFSCDVSFVGSLYTDTNNYYNELHSQAEIWSDIDELVSSQCFNYRDSILENELTKSIDNNLGIYSYLSGLMKKKGHVLDEDYTDCSKDIILDDILKRRVTVLERRLLLKALSETFETRDIRLYTGSDTSIDSSIKRIDKGMVSYNKQMPVVFSRSKINLNITLRTIRTGIPLRALDILACGGFLLSNPQTELCESFNVGEDFETFSSIEECIDKIKYYLDHNSERERIARNGYNKVKEQFSYERGASGLFQLN